jgi:twitching motility protein PilT
MVNTAVANLIENANTRQIYSILESGASEGMQTRDQSLAGLVGKRLVDMAKARAHCRDTATFDKLLQMSLMRGA